MILKLHTSKDTQKIFSSLGNTTGLQPFALSKLAIAMSIRTGKLAENDFNTDNTGLELNRQTIFGESEILFRSLISLIEESALEEDLYFPKLVKAHLDRGAKILAEESRYSKDFYVNLCMLDENL